MKNWDNHDINLQDLQNFLDIDLRGLEIRLNGTYGDPIYHSDFLNLIHWIKQQGARILLVTNGSYKTKEWWETLVGMLDSNDSITFSIDGIPENFTNYRVNADWDSIKIGIRESVKGSVQTLWKYIPFSFNENNIEQARQLSIELGVDKFEIHPSDRWDENDNLKPTINEFQGLRTNSIISWKNSYDRSTEVDPLCYNNKQHFITADGYYAPCCMMTDWRFYYKSKFYENKDVYNIAKTTISQVLNKEQEFFQTLKTEKHSYCTFNCPKI
jgi:MoaA/NifB/PqqE/SkfB family radical SAM enzyme